MQTWPGKAPAASANDKECFKPLTINIPVSHTCKSAKSLSTMTYGIKECIFFSFNAKCNVSLKNDFWHFKENAIEKNLFDS